MLLSLIPRGGGRPVPLTIGRKVHSTRLLTCRFMEPTTHRQSAVARSMGWSALARRQIKLKIKIKYKRTICEIFRKRMIACLSERLPKYMMYIRRATCEGVAWERQRSSSRFPNLTKYYFAII